MTVESAASDNVFAPPKARLEPPPTPEAPPLWNPNAAAGWSLLLSPAFGAYLHMRNWQALGQRRKAMIALGWFWFVVLFIAGGVVWGVVRGKTSLLGGVGNLLILALWYPLSGLEQAEYVKDRWGWAYPRKGWAVPVVAYVLILFFGSALVGIVAGALVRAFR